MLAALIALRAVSALAWALTGPGVDGAMSANPLVATW